LSANPQGNDPNESANATSPRFLQSLFRKRLKDYATQAKTIAKDSSLSDKEKMHALATLSAIHAANARNPEDKANYTRLNENFLKRAESIEEALSVETIAGDSPGQATSEPEGRQVSYIEDVDD
jgi:hypothetical protein